QGAIAPHQTADLDHRRLDTVLPQKACGPCPPTCPPKPVGRRRKRLTAQLPREGGACPPKRRRPLLRREGGACPPKRRRPLLRREGGACPPKRRRPLLRREGGTTRMGSVPSNGSS